MDISNFVKNGKFVKQSVRAKRFDEYFFALEQKYNTSNRSELLWLTLNSRPVCRECGCLTEFKNFYSGYRELCSDVCARKNDLTKQLRVASIKGFFSTHHKVSNPMQLASTKEAVAKTNQKRYGTPWYVSTDSFKEDSKITSLNNWGSENPQSSEKMKALIKDSILSKYGRSTARNFDANRTNRIVTVEKWCSDMSISHDEFTIDVQLGKHLFNFSHDCGYEWSQQIGTLLPACSMCHRGSKVEQSVKAWIRTLKIDEVKFNDRTVIKPLELDIFLPKHNIAIEINGLYWHHDDSGRTSVKDKTDMCAAAGVQLISIWENEWNDKDLRQKIKGAILAKLGRALRIYARKTVVKYLSLTESRDFLNGNHLQGWASASKTVGLIHDGEIVMLMSVGVRRWNGDADKEIIRLCTKSGYSVVGGFSKLLSEFSNQSLLSYCDRRFGNGKGYEKVGFTLDGISKPNYTWWKGSTFLKRGSTTKQRLSALLGEMHNPDLSENENMRLSGWKKLSDAGNLRYILLPRAKASRSSDI